VIVCHKLGRLAQGGHLRKVEPVQVLLEVLDEAGGGLGWQQGAVEVVEVQEHALLRILKHVEVPERRKHGGDGLSRQFSDWVVIFKLQPNDIVLLGINGQRSMVLFVWVHVEGSTVVKLIHHDPV